MADQTLAAPDKAPPPALLQLVSGGGTGLPSDAQAINLPSPKGLDAPTSASAQADVFPSVAKGADWSDETGQFKARVGQLLAAMPPELRQQAQVISGFRTAAQQQDAWQRYQSGVGGLAAQPGMSRHEKGLAADWSFQSPAAQKWMHDNAGQFGLTFPFGSEDPNHMQMIGPPTGGAMPQAGVPDGGAGSIIAAARQRQQEAFSAADREQQLVQKAIERIGTGGRTADQQKQITEARAKADAAVDRAMKLVENPPELQDRGIVERMGGLATVIGILGGLATRRPFMGSMNAAASAMEAYNAGDMRKYQIARDNWRTQSDLLFKIAEINNKRASDILMDQRMDETEKTAELNALFSAAGAESSIALLREKGTAAVQEALQGQFDTAEKWKQLQKQEQIAHDNRMELVDMEHPEIKLYREMQSEYQQQIGHPPSPEDKAEMLGKIKTATGAVKPGASKEIAIVDKDGNTVDHVAARETSGGWVRSDNLEPIVVPPGGKVEVGQAANAVVGSRENVLIQRALTAGKELTSELSNISKLPIDVTTGIFGGRKQGPSLFDATKEVLVNKVTSQDVQIYNDSVAGLQRELTGLISGGVYINQHTIDSFNQLMLKEGDTQLTKMHKLATIRQNTENALESVLTNPRLAQAQRKMAESQISEMKQAIPWTPSDVIRLWSAERPTTTIKDVAKDMGLEGKDAAPASGVVIQNGWRYDAKTHEPIGPAQ